MTHLCVAIPVETPEELEQALATAARCKQQGATLVEWRVDALGSQPEAAMRITALVARSPLPSIVTVRGREEGGLYAGTETERVELLCAVARAQPAPAYIDFELAQFQRSASRRQQIAAATQPAGGPSAPRLILSAHDFTGRPADLTRQVAAMAQLPECAVMKCAWQARSVRDNLEAFELLAARHKPTIALCMGEAGVMSRVLAPKFGAFLTFARAGGAGDADAAAAVALGTAAGQPSVAELVGLYRFQQVGPATRVYGVVGWPVAHSRSPATHNAWLAQHGVDGVYVPVPVPPEYEHFKASVGALLDAAPLAFRGASVTLPHKEHLIRLVRERGGRVEPIAARIGAANTLVVEDDGTLVCTNTDAPAAVDALAAGMGVGVDALQDLRVAVLGTGGVARAVAAGIADAGGTAVVFSRQDSRAEALAQSLMSAEHPDEGMCGPMGGRVVAGRSSQLGCGCFHAFINCTPVGMQGGPDPTGSPLPDDVPLDDRVTIMDTVYAPPLTPLLQEARARGARTVDGLGMFYRQAARQFERWTGVRPAPQQP